MKDAPSKILIQVEVDPERILDAIQETEDWGNVQYALMELLLAIDHRANDVDFTTRAISQMIQAVSSDLKDHPDEYEEFAENIRAELKSGELFCNPSQYPLKFWL